MLSGRVTNDVAPVPFYIEVLLPDPDPRCPLCGMQVGKVSMLVKHFAIRHAEVAVLYKCQKCGRTNPNSHSISCHVPKCKEIVAEVDTNREFACELCGAQFQMGVGLTQYKRHVHPAKLNEERLEGGQEPGRSKGVTKLWSDAEIEALKRLSIKHAGKQMINKLITQEMGTGKTVEQVRSKRRLLQADLTHHGTDEEARVLQRLMRRPSRSFHSCSPT